MVKLPTKVQAALAGWGRFPTRSAHLMRPEQVSQLVEGGALARGLGRSYGDAATSERVLLTERLNRMLSFDAQSGLLRAEAGVTLEEILAVFVPKGWFLPVTPGTKYVTLGGCVACDVHGKNHHGAGSFGAYIKEIELLLPSGERRTCHSEDVLFWATVGGMGLTGVITEVTLQLIPVKSAYLEVQHRVAKNLDQALQNLDDFDDHYSVAWIDCMAQGKNFGRSIVMTGHDVEGEFVIPTKKKCSIPFDVNILNPLAIKAFNALYYRWQGSKKKPFVVDYDTFFYPLDSIEGWNRLYGKQGFVQYQFVVPTEEGLKQILHKLTTSQRASFLAVLKRFGKEGKGLLSFPTEGYTLALDIPVTEGLLPFLDEVDQLVLQHSGRVYLAKDARMQAETFHNMYPKFKEFKRIKDQVDPQGVLFSDLSRRLKWDQY